MRKNKTLCCLIIILALTLLISGCTKTDKQYPTQNINAIIPFKAGSIVETTVRSLQPTIEQLLDTSLVITNKEGAGGVIGFTYIAQSKPDGYTLGCAALSSLCANSVLGEFAYDPREAYDFIAGVCNDYSTICVSADSEFNSLEDVINYSKKNPGKTTFAVTGTISTDAMLCQDFERCADIDLTMVDFGGSADALNAIMGGHVDLMGGTYGEMVSYAESGQLKILAVAKDGLGYPTFEEQSIELSFNSVRRCIVAPKGIPEDVRKTLVDAFKVAVESEDYIERARAVGINPEYCSPEDIMNEADQIMEALESAK